MFKLNLVSMISGSAIYCLRPWLGLQNWLYINIVPKEVQTDLYQSGAILRES